MHWTKQYVAQLLDAFDDEQLPETALLMTCGKDVFDRLRALSAALYANGENYKEPLKDLARTAYLTLSTAKGASVLCWRQFATDVHILLSLDASNYLDAIGILDRVIITTGGASRLDLIHILIGRFQDGVSCPSCTCPDLQVQRENTMDARPASATCSVPILSIAPSLSAFRNNYSHAPFVLRRYAQEWPALNEHPWHSVEYLRSVSGPGRVVPVEVGSDYRTADWKQEIAEWDIFLQSLHSNSPGEAPLYLAQHGLFMQFPKLRDDIVIPDYIFTAPPAPHNYEKYAPPGNEEQLVLNTWLGPKGTVSPAHTDPYFNIYVQIVGKKTVWLAPPECSDYMYSYAAPGQPSSGGTSQPCVADGKDPLMGNTSRVDVFQADRGEHPDFWQRVAPEAMWVTLEAGDVLFFPPGWWHAMRADTISFSVSMWF